METTLSAVAVAQDGVVTAYIREAEISRIREGMPVRVGSSEGVVAAAVQPICADDTFTDYVLHVGGLQRGEWLYAVTLVLPVPRACIRLKSSPNAFLPCPS